MVTAVSSGIRISVDTHYQKDHSSAENRQYLFTYDIRIENTNSFPVQLLGRQWHIVDSNSERREVRGDGVVGEQPIILPGEAYSYRSSCDFATDIGCMYGSYLMKRSDAGLIFRASIPRFTFMVPHRKN